MKTSDADTNQPPRDDPAQDPKSEAMRKRDKAIEDMTEVDGNEGSSKGGGTTTDDSA